MHPSWKSTPARLRPIIEFRVHDSFSSIWLKSIRAVDLDVHCIGSLVGDRVVLASKRGRAGQEDALMLTDFPQPLAWYLCGVTEPYRHADNIHLAFEYAPGESWSGPALRPGVQVALVNAQPIFGWGLDSIPVGAAHENERLFRTCRNFQFAHFLRHERGAPLGEEKKWGSEKPRNVGQAKLL
jgi:hypothetical protein